MRLAIVAALLCVTLSSGISGAARAADAGPWQWQQPMSFPADMPAMRADDLRSHVGGWVHAPDGSVIGSLDSFTTENDAVVRGSMFYMGGMKYLVIPNRDLAVMNGTLYAHDIDAAHAEKSMMPEHLAVGL